MKKILLSLMLLLVTNLVMAQTEVIYKIGEPTTSLQTGEYALKAMSNKGEGFCYYSSSESGNRFYRYDLATSAVDTNDYINSKYVWTVTVLDNGHVTIKWYNDDTKAFPNDEGKNKNFQGSGAAELIPEVKNINGVDYIALTREEVAIGYIHANSPGGNPNLSYWNSYGDDGTCVKFTFYPITEIKDVEETTISYTLTDVAGNEFTGSYTGFLNLTEPEFSGAAGYSLTNKQWDENGFTADIIFPLPVSKEGGITNSTFISNFNANQKWHAVGTDVKVQTASATIEDLETWLWAIYPKCNDGVFTFYVKNIGTDKYVYTDKTGTSFNTKGTVTLSDEGTALEIITWLNKPCFKIPGKTLYLTINGSADTDVYLATWTGGNNNHNGNKLSFTLPGYNLSISSAGVATLYTDYAVSIPDGIEVKYPVAASDGVLTYERLSGTIPSHSAVLLIGPEATYTFSGTNSTASPLQGNLLFGYSSARESDSGKVGENGTVYALGKIDNVVAFYHFVGNTYAAGKAYLEVPSASLVRSYSIFNDFNGTTSIDAVDAEESLEPVVYDLCGRRVKTMHRGIYIVNGKKVIIKE